MQQLTLLELCNRGPLERQPVDRSQAWQITEAQCDPVAYRIAELLLAYCNQARDDGHSERSLWLGVVHRAWHDAACLCASRMAQKSETIASVLDRADAREFFLRPGRRYDYARELVADLAGVDLAPLVRELWRVIAIERLELSKKTMQEDLWPRRT